MIVVATSRRYAMRAGKLEIAREMGVSSGYTSFVIARAIQRAGVQETDGWLYIGREKNVHEPSEVVGGIAEAKNGKEINIGKQSEWGTGGAYTQRNKDGGKYRKPAAKGRGQRGNREVGDEDKERLGRRRREWSQNPAELLAPRKIGLWSPLTISKLRATLPTYPA